MLEEVMKDIHETFKTYFIENCNLDNDEVNEAELETLQGLEPEEVHENLKELLSSLITFKKTMKNTDAKELTQRLIIFEKMIQKLESDIRGHISIQHQMRLDMEAYEFKIEELQKLKSHHIKKIEDLDKLLVDKESEILRIKNKNAVDLEIKLKSIENQFKHEICTAVDVYKKESVHTTKHGDKNLRDLILEKDKEIEKLRHEQQLYLKEIKSLKGKKIKLPRFIKEVATDRTKRVKKNATVSTAELLKTIEAIPKKERKFESPYIRKEMIHIRSASDLGITQKNKLTIL